MFAIVGAGELDGLVQGQLSERDVVAVMHDTGVGGDEEDLGIISLDDSDGLGGGIDGNIGAAGGLEVIALVRAPLIEFSVAALVLGHVLAGGEEQKGGAEEEAGREGCFQVA